MSDISDQRRYYERIINEVADGYKKHLDLLTDENAKLREFASDIYRRFRGVVLDGWSYSSEDFRMIEEHTCASWDCDKDERPSKVQ